MGKWILILNLLGQDHITGEIEWREAVRIENLTFQICIEELVTMVHTFQMEGIQHDVYCKEMPVEKENDE